MRRYNIVHGDTTTAGGLVIAVQTHAMNRGRSLAMIGDEVFCRTCNTTGRIVANGPRTPQQFMGREAALDRDLCMCECDPKPKLINSMDCMGQSMTMEMVIAQGFGSWVGCKEEQPEQAPTPGHGIRTQFVDSETNQPLVNRPYLATVNGIGRQGYTDANGFMNIDCESGSTIEVHLIFKAPAGTLRPQKG